MQKNVHCTASIRVCIYRKDSFDLCISVKNLALVVSTCKEIRAVLPDGDNGFMKPLFVTIKKLNTVYTAFVMFAS